MSILTGNGLIILATKVSRALHTPIYYFLRNFSFLEICYTSVTLPNMLTNLWTHDRSISFLACAIQLCFLLILGSTECLLLTTMAYDHYVAICKPLYYPLIMSHKVCVQLVFGSWTTGIPVMIRQTYHVFSLPFHDSNKLNHVFCDIPPLLKLACSDTFLIEFSVYVVAELFVMIPFLLIIRSYVKIITTTLKLPSNTGKYKAFSTCSSHLIVVILFFGSATITYSRPKSKNSGRTEKILSLFVYHCNPNV
ncbi:olfactory receptor 10AG1-like [Vombatus ursinus]|uniref:olfactory receptor 10AG1-like n=1 Tax=Vombatus ursinus TaxID=29139 RepID=UPI000FFD854F|nr:olfactory receptor 10AG1-like [Vombatus ursinus]